MDSNEKSVESQVSPEHASADSGCWFGKLDQNDFEIDFYQRLAARKPNDVGLLRLLGERFARAGRFDQALAIDERLAAMLPEDPIVVYNLACSLSMNGHLEAALASLDQALANGYHDFAHLEVDPDLDAIRDLPRFAEVLKKYAIMSE